MPSSLASNQSLLRWRRRGEQVAPLPKRGFVRRAAKPSKTTLCASIHRGRDSNRARIQGPTAEQGHRKNLEAAVGAEPSPVQRQTSGGARQNDIATALTQPPAVQPSPPDYSFANLGDAERAAIFRHRRHNHQHRTFRGNYVGRGRKRERAEDRRDTVWDL